MLIAASQILDFLEQHQTFTLERHEVTLPEFDSLRRNLRRIVMRLRESDDDTALDIADGIRIMLSEWLTTPVVFDESIGAAVAETFRTHSAVASRWGSDISSLHEAAKEVAASLVAIENPVRAKLKEIIRQAHLNERRFKIYCHRRAKPHFDSLLTSMTDIFVTNEAFLHSVRDYRDSEIFDVLVKVGPLRSRGWGSAPDAIWTAPRFNALELIVWSGSADEPGFGYDPSQPSQTTPFAGTVHADTHRLPEWNVRRSRTGDDINPHIPDEAEWDELSVFAQRTEVVENRAAKLVKVEDERGIFFPSNAPVLSFNPLPGSREPIDWRIPGETLVEGMFVIMPTLNVDFGDLQAHHGDYSRIWKSRLQESISAEEDRFLERLRSAGLDLIHLGSAVRHWAKEPGTVIHAPQQIAHFEILIRVLRIEYETGYTESHSAIPWWKRAWMEVRRSRGEAIQAGQLETELVGEQLVTLLISLMPEIRREAARHHSFELPVPDVSGMTGTLHFFPVTRIEDGFSLPDGELRIIKDLAEVDQWRD